MGEDRITEVEMRRALAKAAREGARERLEKRRRQATVELTGSRFD